MHQRASSRWPFFARMPVATVRHAMLLVAATCQLVTVVITWSVWQVREQPPNLPLHDALPVVPFGWAMIASLGLAAVRPRPGVALHWFVLVTACAFDQYRLQPQFLGLAVLMLASTGDTAVRVSRWYLVAMWVWTGLHKLLSEDWLGQVSWTLVAQTGVSPDPIHFPAAVLVGLTEITLGLLAWFYPRWGAWLCVAVHLGIVLFLSPLMAAMNPSVLPWNVGIAIVGGWVLWRVGTPVSEAQPRVDGLPAWEHALRIGLLIVPIGFYVGYVDRVFAHVLYSGGLPRGLITRHDGVEDLQSWGNMSVPFPSERRLIRQYFARTAEAGEKLHLSDPRRMCSDQFFVMRAGGPAQVDADEFFRVAGNEVAGIALDRRQSMFTLSRAGVRMLRESDDGMIYAVEFTPDNFHRDLLRHLQGLPNLRQIQFSGTAIDDGDLRHLTSLRLLTGLGLSGTRVTDQGLRILDDLPYLEYIERDEDDEIPGGDP